MQTHSSAAPCLAATGTRPARALAAAAAPPPRPATLPPGRQQALPAAAQCSRYPARSFSSGAWQSAAQRRRLGRAAGAAAAGGGNGAGGAEQQQEEEPQPTPQEMAEAERMLKDFLEGMGAAGETRRPEDDDLPEGRLTYAEAVSLVGMAGWRVSGKLCPAIEEVVAQLEGCWRAVLPDDQFGLLELPERYTYLDSLDPEGREPFSFMALEDPPQGSPEYPRLQIENRAYWSRAFRKMHIEVAVRQDGLQVLHCVLYPRLTFDLPILSMDIVANAGRVSLAIVDPCPVSPNLQLPPFYAGPVSELQARYGLESNRSIPEWGRAIFSPLCVIVRPQGGEELGRFLKYALALNQLHVQIAKIAHPVTTSPGARRRVEALHAAHTRYCEKQLENDKTRRVLEAAFGPELSEAYMQELMFDVEPLPSDVLA